MAGNGYIVGLVVLVVLVVLAFEFAGNKHTVASTTTQNYNSNPTTSTGSSNSYNGHTPVLITDPPHVPPGTSAMVITYSNLNAQTSGVSGYGTATSQSSGNINLLTALNGTAKVMGYVNLTANSSVHAVSFVITSAKATVNGTTYNVTVANPNVVLNVTGNQTANSNSSLVVDLSPTIVVAAKAGANGTSYVMNPSATAVVALNAGVSANASTGTLVSLNSNINSQISAATPTISVTSLSLSTFGSNTNTTVVVRNNANKAVVINGVALYGRENITATSGQSLNLTVGILGGLTAIANAALGIRSMNTASFAATSGGSLQSSSSSSASLWQSAGYTIAPGASATFTYNGQVTYDNGALRTQVVNGRPYRVVVFGSSGASATANTTAT